MQTSSAVPRDTRGDLVVMNTSANPCWIKRCPRSGDTKEHKVPKSAGGTAGRDNIERTCRPCNNAKGSWWMDQLRMGIPHITPDGVIPFSKPEILTHDGVVYLNRLVSSSSSSSSTELCLASSHLVVVFILRVLYAVLLLVGEAEEREIGGGGGSGSWGERANGMQNCHLQGPREDLLSCPPEQAGECC